MTSDETQHVEAEVIDVPEVISGADRWLAEQRAKVADIATEYVPHEITSGKDYAASKRARSQARKEIKSVEDARRAQVGAIKDAVRDFEAQVRDLLVPLKDVDADYKAALDGWERLVVESRTEAVRAWYEDTQGDVASLVPFDTLWARYSEAGKWGLFGTNEVAIQEGVGKAVATIERDLDTIRRAPYEDADREALMAEYLRTLDLSAALRDAEEARQRRERMAQVEQERREREETARAEEERDRQRREQAERDERERAEADRAATLQAAEDARQRRVDAGMEAAPEPEPETAPAAPDSTTQHDMLRDLAGATTWVATVDATKDEIGAMGAYLRQHGLHGGITDTHVALRGFQAQSLRAEAVRLAPRMADLAEVKGEE